MYDWIKTELLGVQQDLHSSYIVSTAPGETDLGDELSQLHRLADTVKSHLWQAQEETTQATQDLVQVQGVLVEQCQFSEHEKISFQVKFDEEKAQLQKGKEQLLTEQLKVKEAVNKALRPVTLVEVKVEDQVTKKVAQLEEVIQQLQQCITDIELGTPPKTP